jgi:ankyrin
MLLIAIHRGNYALAEELISRGADVNRKEDAGLQTALLEAVWRGNKAMVLLLLEKGANIEAKTKYDVSPLQLAVKYEDRRKTFGEDKLIRVLLDHGADPRETTWPGLWKGLDDYAELIRDYHQIPTREDWEDYKSLKLKWHSG